MTSQVTSLVATGYVAARLPHPPIIRRGSGNQTVREGATVRFECRIISDLQHHVQWLKHYTVNGSYYDSDNNGTAYLTALTVSSVPMMHRRRSYTSE